MRFNLKFSIVIFNIVIFVNCSYPNFKKKVPSEKNWKRTSYCIQISWLLYSSFCLLLFMNISSKKNDSFTSSWFLSKKCTFVHVKYCKAFNKLIIFLISMNNLLFKIFVIFTMIMPPKILLIFSLSTCNKANNVIVH